MGKPKDRGLKTANGKLPSPILPETPFDVRTGNSLKAADGHNVDGWAEEDIRIYNDLLNERARLEKEKNELEQKSSRHQTQRALLDESSTTLDSLFRAQFGGEFKFTGRSSCCLDTNLDNACAEGLNVANLPCGHEICSRAKTTGVSWMELDTIKYYHARIMSEKSQRMQNALRKQRDVELVRVKKDDEEELAWRTRRTAFQDKAMAGSAETEQVVHGESASTVIPASLDMVASRQVLLDPKNSAILEAAKENEHVVRRIRGRLGRIRQDVNAGRVSPASARVSLDQANYEMAEAERKNNEFRQLIVDAEPFLSHSHTHSHPPNPATLSNLLQNTLTSSTTDTFSNALSVMRGFFSTSDPQEVQAAIGELRRVLEINGPMTPVLQKSFQALTDMVVSPPARGSTADATASDSRARASNDFVDVMMNLRQKMQASNGPSSALGPHDLNLDDDTLKANFECIKVEEAAKKDMEKIAERMSEDTVDSVTAALKKIKSKALLKSPIPPLSEIVLSEVINDILFHRTVKALIAEAAGPVSMSSVSGKLTSLVITMAQKEPEKYLATLDLVKNSIRKSLKAQKKEAPAVLLEAIAKVEDSIPKFVAAHEEKLRNLVINNKIAPAGSSANPEAASTHAIKHPFARYLLTGELVNPESWTAFKDFFRTGLVHDATKVRDLVITHYHKHRDEGIWDIFRVIADHHTLHTFRFEPWAAEKELYRANMGAAAVSRDKMLDAIVAFEECGVCPGMAAVVVSHRLTYQVREDFNAAKNSTMVLRSIFDHYKPPDNREWFEAFNLIAQAMIDLFAVMIFQVRGLDPKDAPILAADVVGIVCTFVLAAESPKTAATNLHVVQAFISSTLVDNKDSNEVGKLQGVLFRFLHMCKDARYRCSADHRCRAHIKAYNAEKYKALSPAPLNVSKQSRRPDLSRKPPMRPGTTSAVEYLKQRLANEPQERLDAVQIYKQCVHDWETATLLAPHLRCQQRGRTCTCSKEDLRAAEEFQVRKNIVEAGFEEVKTYLLNDEAPPLSVWERLNKGAKSLREYTLRRADLVGKEEAEKHQQTAQVKTRFAEHLGHDSSDAEKPLDARRIKLKQVPVNLPCVQKSQSTSSSETGKMDKGTMSEASAKRQTDKMASAAGPASTAATAQATSNDFQSKTDQPPPPPPSTSAATEEPELSEREAKIANQLVKFVDGVFKLDETGAGIAGITRRDALAGISEQLREMASGHIEMAWIIAQAQGYHGLLAWIERNFGRDEVDADGDQPSTGQASQPQKKAGGKRLPRNH